MSLAMRYPSALATSLAMNDGSPSSPRTARMLPNSSLSKTCTSFV
nr:MAG TPA: hypothetical protein [Caudoviricetes sp.]